MARLRFAHGGEVEVEEGGLERGVTEVGGELMKLGAALEHVGGVGMTQGVGADLVVCFTEATLGRGDFDGGPDAGFGHVMLAVVHGLAQGDAGGFPAAPDTGEEPVNIAMGLPKGAQAGEQRGGDGDFTGLPSLAVADADDEALRVDVLGLEREGFA